MDIALAGTIDGIETVRQIRKRYDIPVVFLSAFSSQSRIDDAKTISPYGYLAKLMEDELLNTIRRALARFRS